VQNGKTMSDLETVTLTPTDAGIRKAAALLRDGKTVAFPTETVYGLGADARNDRAVALIFAAKNRPSFNPLIVHAADIAAAGELAEFSPQASDLAQAFWPGPLTLVLPCRENSGLADLVTAGLDTVAIRIPAHALARRLLDAFGGPVAAPSANPSGKISPTTCAHVLAGLGGRIAAVVDGGPCEVGVESTIIGFQDGAPRLLRAGGLPVEVIADCLHTAILPPLPGQVTAPGQLGSHYAPSSPVRLDAERPDEGEVWLAFGPSGDTLPGLNLSPSGDLAEAATNLFAHLHEIDAMARARGNARIAVAKIPDTGLGRAINDRLRRAAAGRS
jgi:L-threonylcarbamoyladenylate synthase